MLDSRRLRVLCEVARQGSFSAAADALGYTQPAVSRQIAALEAEVGAVLVRRVPQGAVLTDAGRLLSERGAAVLSYLQDMEQELRALLGLEAGTLRLATFASAASSTCSDRRGIPTSPSIWQRRKAGVTPTSPPACNRCWKSLWSPSPGSFSTKPAAPISASAAASPSTVSPTRGCCGKAASAAFSCPLRRVTQDQR